MMVRDFMTIYEGRWVPAYLFLACIASASPAQAGSELFTPDHVAKLHTVIAAEISPDGRSVAYVLNVPRRPFKDEDGPAGTELHVVGPDGTSRPYATGEVNVEAIAWTPDGKGISFLAKRGKDKEKSLYVIPADGGEARKVLGFDTDITSYSWSPDGKRAAFIAKEKKNKSKEKQEEKGFKQEIYEEEFQPDRVWIATIGDEKEKPRALDLPGFPSELHWSPVGTQLAMALAPTPLIDDNYMRRKVHIFDADSGAIVSSFQNPGKLGEIAWSPDGTHLAVISAADLNDPSAGRLLIASPKDGSLREVLPNYEGQAEVVAWQDADTVMFLGSEGVWSTFGEVRRDGTVRKTHVLPGKMTGARAFSLSNDGQSAAMVMDSPTHPAEVFVMRHGDAGPRRVTDSNPWLAEMRFATQEVVTYKERDCLTLDGMIVRPLDEEKGDRYPLV